MASLIQKSLAIVQKTAMCSPTSFVPASIRFLSISPRSNGICGGGGGGGGDFKLLCPIPKDKIKDVVDHVVEYMTSEEVRALQPCIPDKSGKRIPEFCKWAEETVKEGLSLAALQGDKIIGCALNSCVSCESVMDGNSKGCKSSGSDLLIENVKKMILITHQKINLFKKFNVNELFNVHLASEEKDNRGKGLCSKLVTASAEFAVKKGFKIIKSDCVSAHQKTCVEGAGLSEVYKIKYDDYKSDGKIVFSGTKSPNDTFRVYAGELINKSPFVKAVKGSKKGLC